MDLKVTIPSSWATGEPGDLRHGPQVQAIINAMAILGHSFADYGEVREQPPGTDWMEGEVVDLCFFSAEHGDNDGKYDISTGRFVNRRSGEAIPDDEPTFILRARDRHAAQIIHAYAGLCSNSHHVDEVLSVARDFEAWGEVHPDQMKEPDA